MCRWLRYYWHLYRVDSSVYLSKPRKIAYEILFSFTQRQDLSSVTIGELFGRVINDSLLECRLGTTGDRLQKGAANAFGVCRCCPRTCCLDYRYHTVRDSQQVNLKAGAAGWHLYNVWDACGAGCKHGLDGGHNYYLWLTCQTFDVMVRISGNRLVAGIECGRCFLGNTVATQKVVGAEVSQKRWKQNFTIC